MGCQKICCVEKMNKTPKTKQGHYVVCTIQENMFSHETYGGTSRSSYIGAVISGFILSSHSFASQFYWSAPLLVLHLVSISAISLYCCLENSLIPFSVMLVGMPTQKQSLTKFIITRLRPKSNSCTQPPELERKQH